MSLVLDKLAIIFTCVSFLASVATLSYLVKIKGSRKYIQAYQAASVINGLVQLTMLIGDCFVFYGSQSDQTIAGWKIVGILSSFLSSFLVLVGVLCEALLIHLIGAMNPRFTEHAAYLWMGVSVTVYVTCVSMYNINTLSIIITNNGIISSNYGGYDLLNRVLISIWGVFAAIYTIVQNVYVLMSFVYVRKRKPSNPSSVQKGILLILAGMVLCLAAVVTIWINPNTTAENTKTNWLLLFLRSVMVSTVGLRLSLSPLIFLQMRAILFPDNSNPKPIKLKIPNPDIKIGKNELQVDGEVVEMNMYAQKEKNRSEKTTELASIRL